MQRIPTLLQKMSDLAKLNEKATVIDIDLMMDYTRVIYADLLEWRGRALFNASIETPAMQQMQPTTPQTDIPSQPASEPVQQAEPMPVAAEPSPIPAPPAPPVETKQFEPISKFIGINDKYLFISELFGNNKTAYEEVLDEINTMESNQQARNWLDAHIVPGFSWQEENETVQSFYGVLNSFFTSR